MATLGGILFVIMFLAAVAFVIVGVCIFFATENIDSDH